jgi:cAMP-dependent protein kinase regulator
MSKKSQAREYLNLHVKKPLELVVKRVLKKKPADPIPMILGAFEELQGSIDDPMTDLEREELNTLRYEHDALKAKLKRMERRIHGGATEEGKSETTDHKHHQDSDTESEDSDGTLPPLPEHKKGVNRKQRTSVSAEAFGSWNKKGNFKPIVVPKNEETKDKIRARLSKSFLFNSLDEKDFEIVIDAMIEVKLEPSQVVIKEGDDGDYLYVVEKGKLQCSKIFPGNTEPTNLIVYEPGGAFGELALLYNAPRAATITAIDECLLWGLDRNTFNNIVKDAAVKKREMYDEFLKKVEILETMDAYERQTVADAFKKHKFTKGDLIIKEGEQGDEFFFVIIGEAKATKIIDGKLTEVMRYKPGQYFGERALIKKEPRAANIEVVSDDIEVVSLDKDSFNRLLGPVEEIMKRNMKLYSQYTSD